MHEPAHGSTGFNEGAGYLPSYRSPDPRCARRPDVCLNSTWRQVVTVGNAPWDSGGHPLWAGQGLNIFAAEWLASPTGRHGRPFVIFCVTGSCGCVLLRSAGGVLKQTISVHFRTHPYTSVHPNAGVSAGCRMRSDSDIATRRRNPENTQPVNAVREEWMTAGGTCDPLSKGSFPAVIHDKG